MRVFLSYSIGFFFRVIIQRHLAEAKWKFHINPYVFTVCNWMPNRDSRNILSSLRKQRMMTRVSDTCHLRIKPPIMSASNFNHPLYVWILREELSKSQKRRFVSLLQSLWSQLHPLNGSNSFPEYLEEKVPN